MIVVAVEEVPEISAKAEAVGGRGEALPSVSRGAREVLRVGSWEPLCLTPQEMRDTGFGFAADCSPRAGDKPPKAA